MRPPLLASSGRPSESMVGFGAQVRCVLAAGRRRCGEGPAGRSRTDAKGPAHSRVSEVELVFVCFDRTLEAVELLECFLPLSAHLN